MGAGVLRGLRGNGVGGKKAAPPAGLGEKGALVSQSLG